MRVIVAKLIGAIIIPSPVGEERCCGPARPGAERRSARALGADG